MRYHALACDYDGTIAHDGKVDDSTVAALERLRETGRKLILVTGRQLDDLKQVFAKLEIFDRVVAEDGALIYRPGTREEKTLGVPPPPEFVERLRRRGVEPLSQGKVIVATWEPHSHAVLDLIREMGLEYQVIFNKGAVMVLPSGINKAAGLLGALKELGLSPHNVVAVGDAENDHAFLSICECAVAVANALPALKKNADMVTEGERGRGVAELARLLEQDDLAGIHLERHEILLGNVLLGNGKDGTAVRIHPYGTNLLLTGPSGAGKSTVATSFMEQLEELHYQYCIVDPEGDYSDFEGAVSLGDTTHPPSTAEAIKLLERGEDNCAINLLGIPLEERPVFFLTLLHAVLDLRTRTGRPHWLIIDEAHHLFPALLSPSQLTLPKKLHGMFWITVHSEHITSPVLSLINTVVTLGKNPGETIASSARATGHPIPKLPEHDLQRGEAVVWKMEETEAFYFRTIPPSAERRRHLRKYAEGELSPERSFWFRGPANLLNLRAQNLRLFLQIAEGVDDQTWMHHFRQGDYSRWFRKEIKDRKLAEEMEYLEQRELTPEEGRRLIRKMIEEHYTAAA